MRTESLLQEIGKEKEMTKSKALIAMSGGVDSAVAALLLKDSYDLMGITMRLWDQERHVPESLDALPDENATDAKKIADLLGFPHKTVALGESFKECVIKNFIDEYQNGRTPNPCVECNRKLKFGKLFDIADTLDIPYLVTGHYAKIIKGASGSYELHKASDDTKDQSYFLWAIKKERLPFILFPLGNRSKKEIRDIAAENGFENAHRSDSQDICFIPDGDYIAFLNKHGTPEFKKGNFIDTNGSILGTHDGIERYTIGQRKGLGIALGIPMFVGKKNVCNNTVTLCSDRELYTKSFTASSLNLLAELQSETPIKLQAKIRYRHIPSNATIRVIDDKKICVEFDEPQRAISPGQSVVLYDGDLLIGGAIID